MQLRSKNRRSPRKQEASAKAIGGLKTPQTPVARDYKKRNTVILLPVIEHVRPKEETKVRLLGN